jgi:DNA-3-methyladenine glycosylase I
MTAALESTAAGGKPDLRAGADGRIRCGWGLSAPIYLDYHDREWGQPVRTDRGLFERLSLEAFQSGLSWLTILRKRPAFRAAFAGFDLVRVAEFGSVEVDQLLADPGIVRNRAKVLATIGNARAALQLPDGLAAFAWSYAPPPRPRPVRGDQVPAATAESKAMAAALRRNGFRFVGPTTAYALMQAAGMVDDHLAGCQVPAARTDRA